MSINREWFDINYLVKIGLILLILSMLSSCLGLKNLSEGQLVLGKNTIKINTEDQRVSKAEIKDDLLNIIKQEPVNKNPLNPRTWNTPVTIYDHKLTLETVESFQKFLRNTQGFYDAEVSFYELGKGRFIEVIYTVDLGNRMYVKSFRHQFEDSIMQSIMAQYDDAIEVRPGDPLEAGAFEKEKVRMVQVLKNEGYADFNANYIHDKVT